MGDVGVFEQRLMSKLKQGNENMQGNVENSSCGSEKLLAIKFLVLLLSQHGAELLM